MANNYTYTAVAFDFPKKAKAWLDNTIAHNVAREEDDGDFYWGVAHYFEPAPPKGRETLYLSDDAGCPNLDALAELLQQYLALFEPNRVLSFAWADTCSKPRPNEFGGGAAVVSAKKTKFIHTFEWMFHEVEKRRAEIAKGTKKKTKVSRKGRSRV